MIVFSGGSSVGDRDLVLDVLRRRGEVAFHGIATRPGKPTAFGHVGDGAGLRHARQPDVVPDQRLRPAGAVPAPRGPAAAAPAAGGAGVADAAGTSVAGRHQFYTVRLVEHGAEPAFKASADITSMANADGYIEIAADVTAVEAGDRACDVGCCGSRLTDGQRTSEAGEAATDRTRRAVTPGA